MTAASPRRLALRRTIMDVWFVWLAAAIFAIPALRALTREIWTTEQGTHGPIILGTGLWLLLRETPSALAAGTQPGRPALFVPWLVVALLGWLFACITGIAWMLTGTTYLALLAIGYSYVGAATLRRLWFPLFYLLFLVPPPYSVLLATTRALKLWISSTAVDLLAPLGYNVAFSGTMLYIDQYELLVAAACSGMNSLVSLLAIGLFYIYLRHRADWRYAGLLALMVIPIAVIANLLRVIILLLVTHYLGNEAAQGLLHEAAGMLMFFIALGLLFGVDLLLEPLARRLSRQKS